MLTQKSKTMTWLSTSIVATVGIVATVFLLVPASSTSQESSDNYAVFNAEGNLERPINYREWIFVGTGTTPLSHDPEALFPDFQNIYMDPISYRHWVKTGEFRDGAILVKELITEGRTTSPVGNGFWQGEYRSLSATVKSKEQFPDTFKNWNYFNFTDADNAVLTPTAAPKGKECSVCHQENATGGTVFYDYYSVLRTAKGPHDTVPENLNTRKGLVKK